MSQVNERAQVPGYCGYIPGKNSQNKFGSSFCQITKGSYKTQNQAFLTTNSNNAAFLQQQYSKQDQFWGSKGKVNAFEKPQQQKTNLNTNQIINKKKYVPEKMTNLTYEEALKKTGI